MSTATDKSVSAAQRGADVGLTETFGWHRHAEAGLTAWFKGYVWLDGRLCQGTAAARLLAARLPMTLDTSGALLRSLEGHFAIVVASGGAVLAATDRVRTIPLFWAKLPSGYVVDADARRLRDRLPDKTIDEQAALEVALAGYALGPATLYRDMRQLEVGEVALFENGRQASRRYYTYDAWKEPRQDDRPALRRALYDAHVAMFERLKAGLDGRPVLLPLSGGLDSRLIACGLAHVGYRNVRCFAYGRPGNFEARKSQEVAEALGYPWTFAPYTPRTVRAFAQSAVWREHMAMADSCASVPFVQDLFAIHQLREKNAVPADAVFINGQSGDFITGNHVPAALHVPARNLDWSQRRTRIEDALIAKHFSLWRDLKTETNLARVRKAIGERIAAASVPIVEATADHGVYELIEYQERQAKFVVSGQRVYEFHGYDWRLPLWDNAYCDLFERMPLSAKINQSLFREVLEEANWGGVWRPMKPAPFATPAWAGHLRRAARALMFAAPRSAWEAVDRRAFAYLLDGLCVNSQQPYSRFLLDKRGARHGVAFRCESYLAEHRIGPDGKRRATA